LTDLGFLPENMKRYEQSYRKPYGTILVTGPTGSGKSTTLYATLNIVNDESKNVITVEDPVEYRLPNINQVQVNVKAGLTFAAALRSILRSDPDIVLVGEIRDRETANIAIQAALTGHLVLSTLHTNDAPDRDGCRAVPGGERLGLHRGPTARPASVRQVQGAIRTLPGRVGLGGMGHRGRRR
jgi:type IV pilus assembly protein PilB